MDYTLAKKNQNNRRLTIGYLDENTFEEYHCHIISGMFEAAQKYDMNIIRFGHFGSNITYRHNFEINLVLNHIEQYNLDGLIFLGWARAATFENHENFKKRFSSIPILSLGSGFVDIPSVYFPGDQHIREILYHLINHHGYKKIAFICPFWPDNRLDVYINIMKEYGIYDPELCVNEKEIANLDVPQRGRRAVSILLDKRKVSIDAIISLYNAETEGIVSELQSRGLKIPDDIAVTSYEDGDIGKFSSPPFTTVYIPWRELGYFACEKMAELLKHGHTPISTPVRGKIILRDSCGCISSTILNAKAGKVVLAAKTINQLSKSELYVLSEEIRKEIVSLDLDINGLLKAFIDDLENRSYTFFSTLLDLQLGKIPLIRLAIIEDSISIFRKYLLPYISHDKNVYLWSENLFQQAQILLRERISGAWVYEEIQTRRLNQILQEISQHLITNFSIESILDSLELNLSKLDIPSCYIFLFNDYEENNFDDCSLALEYCCHARTKFKSLVSCNTKQKISEFLSPKDKPYAMLGHLLHVSDKYIGFVIFEAGPLDERIYQALSIHISTALSGAILLDKLDNSYKKLVHKAHKKGMTDIATGILHNVNNVLNSINTSTHMLKDLVSSSPIDDLLKANELLEKNIDDLENFIINDTKGKKLMQFYVNLEQPFKDLHSELLYNIQRLNDKIILVDDIVSSQQNYIGIKSTLEELHLATIVEDALKLNLITLEKHKIKVSKNFSPISNVFVQRTKLFHVLLNLIKNSMESMIEVHEDKRELNISIVQDSHGKYIQISDTGNGIPSEFLEGIFAFGYTTKIGGHGFGLHSCANYMTEMGGKVWAESNGVGKGATFILQFK